MKWLHRLTLGQKFLAAFALLLILLGLSLAAILFYLSRINSYVERHKRITVPAISTAADMQRHMFEVISRAHSLYETGVAANRSDVTRQLAHEQSEIKKALLHYQSTHAARTHPITFDMLTRHGRAELADREDRALGEINEALEELKIALAAVTGGRADRPEAEARASLDRVDVVSDRLTSAMSALIDVHTQIDHEMKDEGDSLLFQAKLVILALVLLLGLVIIGAYVVVSRQIARPLRRLAETAKRVAHHDLTAGFDPWPADDEVGNLARSLETMLANIRERTSALERKTRELESFTYSAAHDLKTPLREIEGFSSLLERKFSRSMEPTARHYVTVIHDSSLRLTALIDDLLRYSRLEQQTLLTARINLRDLLEEVIAERAGAGQGTRPRISLSLPYTSVTGEPASIRQVLVNLLDNAIKFSRDAHPSDIVIGGATTQAERILWVRDNGIGIDTEQAHRIFGLFERLHGPEDYEGTGVGLAIVKLVMDKHRGRVWVESAPGKGSTFYVAFPHAED